METSVSLPNMLQKILLSCGILAPLLYLGTDLLAGKLNEGYSFSAQSMSELGAAGSPTRPLVVALTLVASAFMIAFGFGVWRTAGPAILPRMRSRLILGNVVAGLAATLLLPNHFGDAAGIRQPGCSAHVYQRLVFRVGNGSWGGGVPRLDAFLSVAIPAANILLAILRFATAASSIAGPPVMIGAQERSMAYSFLLWTMALAIYLLLSSKGIEICNKNWLLENGIPLIMLCAQHLPDY